MSLKEFKKKLEKHDGLYRLNFAVEEEREYYLESVGGEENLKKNFPLLYESFLRECEEAKDRVYGEETEDISFEIYDIVPVAATAVSADMANADEKSLFRLSADIVGEFPDTNRSLSDAEPAQTFTVKINGMIYDPNSSRLPYVQFRDRFTQTNRINRSYQGSETYYQKEFWNRTLTCVADIQVYDSNNKMKAYTYTHATDLGNPTTYPFDEIKFDHPRAKNENLSTNEIRILYARTASNLDHPDYIYKTNIAENNKGYLWTIVPMSGIVKLKRIFSSNNHYSFDKLTEPRKDPNTGKTYLGRSILFYNDEEWITYRDDLDNQKLYDELTDGKHFTVTKSESDGTEILKFDFYNSKYEDENNDRHYDWGRDIDKASTDNRQRICYLTAGFIYDINIKNEKGEVVEDAEQYSITCRSADPDFMRQKGVSYYEFVPGSQTVYIPPVHLWWGCHARDTQIKLSDGSCKRADEIKTGDKLIAYGGKILTVNNVYHGDEKRLISIKTDSGQHIRVSEGHPLLKEDGTEEDAVLLSVGDRILAESGLPVTVTSVETEPYDDQVYNFSFEGEEKGNYVIAGGLYSGDFYAQNMRGIRKPVPPQEHMDLAEELDRLVQQMNDQ